MITNETERVSTNKGLLKFSAIRKKLKTATETWCTSTSAYSI